MKFEIFSTTDAALLSRLHTACFPKGWAAKEFTEMLFVPGTFAVVLSADDEACGFVLVRAVAGEAEILSIGVLKEYRGMGMAQALMMAAEDGAAEAGANAMFLEVSRANDAAINLYYGLGFDQISRRAKYYADGTDALILKKPLGSA